MTFSYQEPRPLWSLASTINMKIVEPETLITFYSQKPMAFSDLYDTDFYNRQSTKN